MIFELQYKGVWYKFTPSDGEIIRGGIWSISDRADAMGIVCDYSAADYGLDDCIRQFNITKAKFTAHKDFNPQHN